MKWTLLLLLLALGAGSSLMAQKNHKSAPAPPVAATAPRETIEMKELSYDFGRIPQGRPVTHNFELVNKGKAPLVLDNVQASCGCTTPEWSETPIPSGNSSVIKVGFNAASDGHFTKTITISYNNGLTKAFAISGEVYPSPTTSAPLNTSLSLLK